MEFIKESFIAASPERVFSFHEMPDALEKLSPPWESVKLIQRAVISEIGSRAIIETRLFGIIPARWVAEHTAYEPPRMFEDIQISGPFREWRHRHLILPAEGGSILRDEIEFEPPFGFLGRPFAPFLVIPKLEKMFGYRHQVTKEFCES